MRCPSPLPRDSHLWQEGDEDAEEEGVGADLAIALAQELPVLPEVVDGRLFVDGVGQLAEHVSQGSVVKHLAERGGKQTKSLTHSSV